MQVVWLEDDDLVHLVDRSYAVYRLARDRGPVWEAWEGKPHSKPALLAVERALQTLDVRALRLPLPQCCCCYASLLLLCVLA